MRGNLMTGMQYVVRGFQSLNKPGLRPYVALPLLLNFIVGFASLAGPRLTGKALSFVYSSIMIILPVSLMLLSKMMSRMELHKRSEHMQNYV